jgi:hypothetical protein
MVMVLTLLKSGSILLSLGHCKGSERSTGLGVVIVDELWSRGTISSGGGGEGGIFLGYATREGKEDGRRT